MNKLEVLDKGASFIKVLGGNFSNQLQIPRDFTKIFNGDLPHRFIIESSMTKKCWRVEVEKDGDGTTYLGDGWPAFVEAHCLEFGNILLFEYEEQSVFQVKIYDRNGCRKSTLVKTKESRPNSPKVTDIEEESKCEALQCEPKILGEDHRQISRLPTQKYNNGIYNKNNAASRTYKRSLILRGNKTTFSCMITKKYQFNQQNIPVAVIIYNKLGSRKEVLLQVDDANCWTVHLGHKKGGQSVFLGGWKDFLLENNITFGDKLDFEFESDKLAQVHVTRSSELADHLREPKCNNENGKRADNEHTCSSFSIPWSKSKASHCLYIPRTIAVEHMLENKDSVTLRDSDGNEWPVEVRKWKGGRVDLMKGWSTFWKGLAIQDGDTLECQFVSHRVIQVNINRHERPNDSTVVEATIDREVKDNVNGLLQVPPGFMPKEQHRL